MKIQVKRAYEPAAPSDGFRILVDRLWPRGISKAKAQIDLWLKEVAPSPELRTWFGHDPAKWKEFRSRYLTELRRKSEEIDQIRAKARVGTVTLVYAAKDEQHNDAVVLLDRISRL